jgi:hypothetical protein
MDDEIKDIRAKMEKMEKRLGGDVSMDKAEIEKNIAEAKAWLAIMEESQKTRERFGQKLATDFKLELGNDTATTRVIIGDLEKAVYGGILNAMRKRLENVERAFKEQGLEDK